MAGIYVHIPFCKSKCRYCDFASFPDKITFAESYMACVYREMAMRKEELKDYTFERRGVRRAFTHCARGQCIPARQNALRKLERRNPAPAV